MGWWQKDGGVTAVSWVDVIRPYCQKPSTCVRSCAYRTGMKMYWLLCDNVWTVCSIRCVILTCTVIQSPPHLLPVNVVVRAVSVNINIYPPSPPLLYLFIVCAFSPFPDL